MSRATESATYGCLVIIISLGLYAVIGAIAWPYSVNSWLALMGKAPRMEWWQGALFGCIPYLGKFSVPVAVATWLAVLLFA